MPVERTETAIAAINGNVYVVGSLGADGVSARTFAYNLATDTWTERTPMPRARRGAVATTVSGRLYVIGGPSGLNADSVTGNCYMYTPTTNV